MHRYLLVIDQRGDFDAMAEGLRHYEGAAADASFVVLVPDQGELASASSEERARARDRTRQLKASLERAGVSDVVVHVSSADTVDAVRRELGNERFDEIIVAAPPERLGRFFGVDDTHKLQRAFDVPLVSLIDPHGHRLRSDDFDSTGPSHPR